MVVMWDDYGKQDQRKLDLMLTIKIPHGLNNGKTGIKRVTNH